MEPPKKFSLTDFMFQARFWLIMVGVSLVFVMLWQMASKMIATKFGENAAPVLPAPTYTFGALPAVSFPAQLSSVRPSTYEMMIPNVSDSAGGWPVFGDMRVVNVYKLQPLTFSLSADTKARSIAENLGFEAQPRILDDRTYLFTYPGPPLEENLQIDTRTMFVTLKTNFTSVTNFFGIVNAMGNKELPDRAGAISAVRNYLATAGILPEDLSDQAATVEYVRAVGSSLQPVNNAWEADFATVSLPRVSLDGMVDGEATRYNFYGPDNVSSIYAVVGRDLNGQNVVVELQDYYYQLDLSEVATYPLRSVGDAWRNLQAGEAYVVNQRNIQNAVIRSVELGYYESHDDQEYLLPIYVFKGDNGVIAYVQALDPRVIRN